MDSLDVYDNPLISRYASPEMARLWGPRRKFTTWRRLWVALAEAQAELGLLADDGVTPRITPEMLQEMLAHIDDVDFAVAERARARETARCDGPHPHLRRSRPGAPAKSSTWAPPVATSPTTLICC